MSYPQHRPSSPKGRTSLNHCLNFSLNTVRDEVAVLAEILQYSETGQERTKVIMMSNRKLHAPIAFNWYRNQRPWMTLNGHYLFNFTIRRLLEPTMEI